jgi:hypothetical protein
MATNVLDFSGSDSNAPERLIYRGCAYVRSESKVQAAQIAQPLRYRGMSYSNTNQNSLSLQAAANLIPLRYRGLNYFSTCYSN